MAIRCHGFVEATRQPMHELAIADAVLSIALEHAAERKVSRIGMRVGHLRQVVPSALRFSFALIARDTQADGAILDITAIPVCVWCEACGMECAASSLPLQCIRCASREVVVRRGDEMLVDWIETEE